MTISYLSVNGVANHLGISPHTVRNYWKDGRLPAPDATIGHGDRPTLGWLPETIDTWNASRPGHGGRPPKNPTEK